MEAMLASGFMLPEHVDVAEYLDVADKRIREKVLATGVNHDLVHRIFIAVYFEKRSMKKMTTRVSKIGPHGGIAVSHEVVVPGGMVDGFDIMNLLKSAWPTVQDRLRKHLLRLGMSRDDASSLIVALDLP